MANKGSLQGQTLMSEKTWSLMHSDLQVKEMAPMGTSNYTKGGFQSYESIEKLEEKQKAPITPHSKFLYEGREGYYGW